MKTVRIQPGQTINVPVAIRTNATYETTNMIVELNNNMKGLESTPTLVTLKNNSSLE